jgi:hypothetical protein
MVPAVCGFSPPLRGSLAFAVCKPMARAMGKGSGAAPRLGLRPLAGRGWEWWADGGWSGTVMGVTGIDIGVDHLTGKVCRVRVLTAPPGLVGFCAL